jgi:hypothetical protein
MFKDTCPIALKRKDRSPSIFQLEILIYLILDVFIRIILKVFIYLILKSLCVDSRTNLLTHKHTITQMQQSREYG